MDSNVRHVQDRTHRQHRAVLTGRSAERAQSKHEPHVRVPFGLNNVYFIYIHTLRTGQLGRQQTNIAYVSTALINHYVDLPVSTV